MVGVTNGSEFAAALRRRRDAANRCQPLPDGRRDPHTDRRPRVWSPREIDSWLAAGAHLWSLGYDVRWAVPEQVRHHLARAS